MTKYKAIFKGEEKHHVIGTFDTREKAVKACIDYKDSDYCLDDRNDRIKCFERRDFCICGCGPNELSIQIVEE